MTKRQSTQPPFDHLLITSHEVLINAWEVFQLMEERTKTYEILKDSVDWDAGEAIKGHNAFEDLMRNVAHQVRLYRKSIETAAKRRGVKVDILQIDAIEAFAHTLDIRDKLVCHAAMLKAYNMIQTTYSVEHLMTNDPVEVMQRTYQTLKDYLLGLFELQMAYKNQALKPYRDAGFPVDDWNIVANPFGKATSGPLWDVMEECEGDPRIPPSSKTPRMH